MQSFALVPLLLPLMCLNAAVVPPPWADPQTNPCALRPGGWQLLHWPSDDKCYRIFTIGAPCPDTMELGPSVTGRAECRCPPKTAQSPRDAKCHQLFKQEPCEEGQYFAPVRDTAKGSHHWGTCRDAEPCPLGQVFWARDGQCHRENGRGPCPRGELLTASQSGLGMCRCASDGPLAPYFSPATQTCHEHYTRGPCEQRGYLFLPGRGCGCYQELPHYHAQTGRCYEIGSVSPCPPGQQFLLPDKSANSTSHHAYCQCKKGLVLWADGNACYRLYTRGPCPQGQILMNSTTCAPIPCRNGRLYFPSGPACYKVGTQGPCPDGQLVLFESVRISVNGISYRGMCGCSGPDGTCSQVVHDNRTSNVVCDFVSGFVKMNNQCHKFYSQGPCSSGEWLVPEGDGRQWDDSGRKRQKAKCDCKPGFKRLNLEGDGNSEKCQSPTVVLARFLNLNRTSEPMVTSAIVPSS